MFAYQKQKAPDYQHVTNLVFTVFIRSIHYLWKYVPILYSCRSTKKHIKCLFLVQISVQCYI